MKRLIALGVLLVLGSVSCAHVPPAPAACAADVTPQLVQTAAGALAGQDYEGAVARELAGLAACLVLAAVEAAVDQAKRAKLSTHFGGGVDQGAVARHGDAWLAAHRKR